MEFLTWLQDHGVPLLRNERGELYANSQLTDYVCRGQPFETSNLVTYFTESYETRTTATTILCETLGCCRDFVDANPHPGARISYSSDHPHYSTRHRAVRQPDHNNLPNFVGPYFCKRDDDEPSDLFFASMLMLFKPWRKLEEDLKRVTETWKEAFERWLPTTSFTVRRMMDNIQYYYECQRSDSQPDDEHETEDDAPAIVDETEHALDDGIGKEDSQFALELSPSASREALHGKAAIKIAQELGFFADPSQFPATTREFPLVRSVTQEDIRTLDHWMSDVEHTHDEENHDASSISTLDQVSTPDVLRIECEKEKIDHSRLNISHSDESPAPLRSAEDYLKVDQLRAYEIITWHLDETLAGHRPPPLRLIVNGEGGTGKSKLIEAVTDYFAAKGSQHLLVKMAYTGIAASHIQGITCHAAAMISRNDRTLSNKTKTKLQEFWGPVLYEILDEFSMLGKTFFAKLSRSITIGKATTSKDSGNCSFGETSVIITGDEHQFPPVACTLNEALYFPSRLSGDTLLSQIGRSLYEEFSTVVTLKQQVRVIDPVWNDFLRHLRHGQVEPRHIEMLETLCLTNPHCSRPDFTQKPWNAAVLVTPRHAVRAEWNQHALRKHCNESGQQIFVLPAEHRTARRALNAIEQHALRVRSCSSKADQNELPETLELAIGMPVLVTQNIHTELDITNGARGTLVDIILDPAEPIPSRSQRIVNLQHPPAFILVKLYHSRAPRFGAEDNTTVPICPVKKSIRLNLHENSKKTVCTVTRRQLPITAAYALTDYRAQGQTIPAVILDLAPPPTGKLSLFNLYVALSRSSGRETIRLLRDFDEKALLSPHLSELTAEDDRLARLNEATASSWQALKDARANSHFILPGPWPCLSKTVNSFSFAWL